MAALAVDQGAIGLRVDWGDQEPAGNVYFALVPEHRPWSEPLYEQVVSGAAETVEWTVPPGRYRYLVGAPGYHLVYGKEIRVAPGQTVGKTEALDRLAPLPGQVRTLEGVPVRGAKVGIPRAFLSDFAGRLSAMGEAALASSFVVWTDADGRFSLPAEPGFRHTILVEHEGLAPGFLRDVLFDPPGHAGPWEVVLALGASLEIRLTGGPAAEQSRIWLHAVGSHPLQATGIDPPGALWQRRPSVGAPVKWPALPAGVYAAWWRPERNSDTAPVLLGRFELKSGEAKSIDAEVPVPVRAADLDPLTRREATPIRILGRNLHLAETDGYILEHWRQGRMTLLSPRHRQVSGGTRFEFEVACRVGDRFVVKSSKSIGATAAVTDCASDLTLEGWPRADLVGSLELPVSERGAESTLLKLKNCNPETEAELVEIPVALNPKGGFETAAPAGCFDVLAFVSDLAPARWDHELLRPEQQHRLERRALRVGGALQARIVSAQTARGVPGVQVALLPPDDLEAAVTALAAGRRFAALATTVTDDAGWLRLDGIEPGDYRLRIADGRRWPHISEAVGIRAGDQLFLPEVPLPAPVEVEIEVIGDEALFSEVERLTVTVANAEEALQPLALSTAVGEDRRAHVSEMPPGRWRFSLITRLAGAAPQPIGDWEHEVVEGGGQSIRLEAEALLFRGVVLREKEPVEGALMLTTLPAGGAEAQRLQLRTDPDGEFRVLLRRAGDYEAVFSPLEDLSQRALVPRVSFTDPAQEVEIELPDGRLAGQVVDPNGEPVAGAAVRASALREPEQVGGIQLLQQVTRSDGAGQFEIAGLPSAAWNLLARAGDLESDPLTVDLGCDQRVHDLRVELREHDWITGSVVDERGLPLGEVHVEFFFVSGQGDGEPVSGTAVSDPDGILRLDARGRRGERAIFRLRAKDGRITAMRRPVAEGLSLVVPERAGAVRFAFETAADAATGVGSLALVQPDGAFVDVRAASEPALQGLTRLIPRLSPGSWRLVRWRSLEDLALLHAGNGGLLAPLQELTIEAGGAVEVSVSHE